MEEGGPVHRTDLPVAEEPADRDVPDVIAEQPAVVIRLAEQVLAAAQAREQQRAVARAVPRPVPLEPIIEAGLAPRLWQMLSRTASERFVSAKLTAAIEIGGGKAVLWAIGLPAPAEPTDRLA